MSQKYWLMKAEPETRMEKGKDVAFSIDMFREMGVSQWDGVRNHQAKNFMKNDMKLGDKVLFYHSNCKLPGIAGIAEVCKEGYPDYTAWDSDHPYFDSKSDKDKPTWFMVDVKFNSKFDNFVSLKLLQNLTSSDLDSADIPNYLESDHLAAIKGMPLLSRGRLSVQPVEERAFEAIVLLGEKGGFSEHLSAAPKQKRKTSTKSTTAAADSGENAVVSEAPSDAKVISKRSNDASSAGTAAKRRRK